MEIEGRKLKDLNRLDVALPSHAIIDTSCHKRHQTNEGKHFNRNINKKQIDVVFKPCEAWRKISNTTVNALGQDRRQKRTRAKVSIRVEKPQTVERYAKCQST